MVDAGLDLADDDNVGDEPRARAENPREKFSDVGEVGGTGSEAVRLSESLTLGLETVSEHTELPLPPPF